MGSCLLINWFFRLWSLPWNIPVFSILYTVFSIYEANFKLVLSKRKQKLWAQLNGTDTERGREREVDRLGRHQFQFSYESAAKSVTRYGKAPVFRMRRGG